MAVAVAAKTSHHQQFLDVRAAVAVGNYVTANSVGSSISDGDSEYHIGRKLRFDLAARLLTRLRTLLTPGTKRSALPTCAGRPWFDNLLDNGGTWSCVS